jgi:hypothetical protein
LQGTGLHPNRQRFRKFVFGEPIRKLTGAILCRANEALEPVTVASQRQHFMNLEKT